MIMGEFWELWVQLPSMNCYRNVNCRKIRPHLLQPRNLKPQKCFLTMPVLVMLCYVMLCYNYGYL